MTDIKQPQNELNNIRKEYDFEALEVGSMNQNPIKQLNHWLDFSINNEVIDPTAMTLATCDANYMPDARIVLLKGIDSGLIFFTHYESKKGKDLDQNPNACINFFWPELERQIRIQGRVEKISSQDSQTYFASRPHTSQLSAMVSPQSQLIDSISTLEKQRNQIEKDHTSITCPSFWGGFRLIPQNFEFWQGRPNRLHDRLCYTQSNISGKPQWKITRKAP